MFVVPVPGDTITLINPFKVTLEIECDANRAIENCHYWMPARIELLKYFNFPYMDVPAGTVSVHRWMASGITARCSPNNSVLYLQKMVEFPVGTKFIVKKVRASRNVADIRNSITLLVKPVGKIKYPRMDIELTLDELERVEGAIARAPETNLYFAEIEYTRPAHNYRNNTLNTTIVKDIKLVGFTSRETAQHKLLTRAMKFSGAQTVVSLWKANDMFAFKHYDTNNSVKIY
jgi:hypothetical protein